MWAEQLARPLLCLFQPSMHPLCQRRIVVQDVSGAARRTINTGVFLPDPEGCFEIVRHQRHSQYFLPLIDTTISSRCHLSAKLPIDRRLSWWANFRPNLVVHSEAV